jgi:ElaB/YqjD/DUF883 family membrane-anchored ribosome-binding protein
MTNARILKKHAHELAGEAGEYLADEAKEFIEDGAMRLEDEIDEAAEQFEEKVNGRNWKPLIGLAAGIALVAGAIYLSRHRAQRMLVQKGLKRGLQEGTKLAIMLPGGLRKARESADVVLRESARLWDKLPVRVVMK